MPFMRILLPFLLLGLSSPALADERRYTVTDFDRVVVEGPYEVVLRTGKAPSARATGPRMAVERVTVEVLGRTLRVRTGRSAWGGYPGEDAGPAIVELTTHEIRSATVAGSGGLSIDKARGMRLDLALEGSGRLSVADVKADTLVVGSLGSGQIGLAGQVKSLRASVQGAGDLDGSGLTADDAQVSSETSGTIELNAKRSARIVARGSGDTKILGKIACTVNAVGSGRVVCGED